MNLFHLLSENSSQLTRKNLIMNGLDFKNYRKNLGISQETLGKALFVSKRTIVTYEQSEKVPQDKVQLMRSIYEVNEQGEAEGEAENDIEVLYAEHIAFKKALSIIKDKGVKAYEIHKKTGLNESGLRRILNEEIDNPQRKTRQVLIDFAGSISPEQENVDFRDLKIDDKLNVIFNQLQKINTNEKAISSMKEDIALNNEMICKIDRSLMIYNLNIQAIIKEAKNENIKVVKLS